MEQQLPYSPNPPGPNPYEVLPDQNNHDIQLDIPPPSGNPIGQQYLVPITQPIPFYTGKNQTPITPVSPSSLLPISYETGYRKCLRWTILLFEFICVAAILIVLILRYMGFLNLNYTILSTLVDVRDTSITYTVVTRPQIMFFFYRKNLVNASTGITVTSQNYIEKVNLTDKCNGTYEYYPSQSAADAVEENVTGPFAKVTMVIDLIVILLAAILKLLISKYVKENDIPMMLKLRIKSKYAYEMTIYTCINVVILSLVGILIPLLTMNYDSDCMIANVNYTIEGIFKGYYALMICFICYAIPLLAFVVYKYLEDDMKYACFGLFWVMLPAFLLDLFTGHAMLILTVRQNNDFYIYWLIVGSYIMLALSCVITGTVSVVEWLDFGTKRAAVERRELRIAPSSSGRNSGINSAISPNPPM